MDFFTVSALRAHIDERLQIQGHRSRIQNRWVLGAVHEQHKVTLQVDGKQKPFAVFDRR